LLCLIGSFARLALEEQQNVFIELSLHI